MLGTASTVEETVTVSGRTTYRFQQNEVHLTGSSKGAVVGVASI
jgi:hypothetical protein